MEKHVLRPSKFSDIFWRGLYGVDYGDARYVVEVDFFDIKEKVRLYRDDRLVEEGNSPASFDIGDATIEVAMALYGMKTARLVPHGQRPRPLTPLPGTAEDRRLSFGREHPVASMLLAAAAWIVLAVALVTQVPNLLNSIGYLTGWSVPTFGFPEWLNAFLGIAGILAGLDRGLRMKHNPLLND